MPWGQKQSEVSIVPLSLVPDNGAVVGLYPLYSRNIARLSPLASALLPAASDGLEGCGREWMDRHVVPCRRIGAHAAVARSPSRCQRRGDHHKIYCETTGKCRVEPIYRSSPAMAITRRRRNDARSCCTAEREPDAPAKLPAKGRRSVPETFRQIRVATLGVSTLALSIMVGTVEQCRCRM